VLIHALLAASLALTSTPVQAAAQHTKADVDCTRVKCLALTFDDGPSKLTPTLLKTLKKANAKATFFLEGQNVEKFAATAKQELAQGHAVGNHTYSHPWLPTMLDHEILDELKVTQELITKATGKRPTMYRPPYGRTDQRVLGLADQENLAEVLWTGSTRDWDLKDTKKIKEAALKLAKRDGIILMHDVVPETVKVMPELLKELKKQGYHLVTVPTLLRAKGGPKSGVSYPS
jgi:peptidoglycan-N-acetylglucosamine deacetylase